MEKASVWTNEHTEKIITAVGNNMLQEALLHCQGYVSETKIGINVIFCQYSEDADCLETKNDRFWFLLVCFNHFAASSLFFASFVSFLSVLENVSTGTETYTFSIIFGSPIFILSKMKSVTWFFYFKKIDKYLKKDVCHEYDLKYS